MVKWEPVYAQRRSLEADSVPNRGILDEFESFASRHRIQANNIVQSCRNKFQSNLNSTPAFAPLRRTHDFEKRLGVHSLGTGEIGTGLLERVHGCTNAVHSSHAGHEGEDDNLRTHVFCLLTREARRESSGDDIDENLRNVDQELIF